MQKQELKEILNRYKSGIATDEEKAFLESWYLQFHEEGEAEYTVHERMEDAEAIWQALNIKNKEPKPLWPKLIAAASVVLFLGFGAFYYISNKHNVPVSSQISKNAAPEIAPGGNKAILTLSNGKKILLTGIQNGQIAIQGKTVVNKTAEGQIVYSAAGNNAPDAGAISYNTISTPKGGQFWVTLPDGTRVMLNASSSLRYPTAFGKERKVELTGEAYFEVIHNAAAPFKVVTGNETVEDLGTHFNINAYNDDHVTKTTLLEGRVKISNENRQVVLNPGQQSQLNVSTASGVINVIENADTEAAVAWKNGLFEFKNTDVQQVMLDIARWYDLDVVYEGKKPDLKISGRVSRYVNFSGMIKILQFEGVKFRINGKTVTVID